MKDYVNWAILAPGSIANSMAAAMNGSQGKVKLYAVGSRNIDRAKEFATKWDMMCDDGELTIPQKIDAIKRVTPHYEAATQTGKLQIIEALRATLDLGPDSPAELQDAFKELLMGNC